MTNSRLKTTIPSLIVTPEESSGERLRLASRSEVNMANRWKFSARVGLGVAVAALFLGSAPAACLYPEFQFTEPEPGGGGGDATTSSSSSASSSASSSSGESSSSSGSSSSGGSSSSSASSSSGAPGSEDCLNGADDDNDGMVDCADSDCTVGATCVSTVPFNWSGYAVLFEGVPAQEPACPSSFPSPNPYIGHTTPTGGAATCSACACGGAANETCVLPTLLTLQNKACGVQPNFTGMLMMPANWDGSCHGPDGYSGGNTTCNGPCNVSVKSTGTSVTGGACPTSGGVANVPQLNWAILGKACGDPAVGGGCGAGKTCVAKPPLPFLSGLCVYKSGMNACPAGEFSQQHIFYGNADDTRGCTNCTCGAPSGSTCAADIDLYMDQAANACTMKVATINVTAAGGCAALANNPAVAGRKATITQAPSGGTCTPSGGQPTGQITPIDPTTFCCVP